MRVLVDTSVWSLAFRKGGPVDHPMVKKLESLLRDEGEVVLIGIILQEILQGIRQDKAFKRVVDHLGMLPLLPLRRSDYVAAAQLFQLCRAKGIACSTPDCLIAAAAIEHMCHLLSADQDFQHMARISSLQLL